MAEALFREMFSALPQEILDAAGEGTVVLRAVLNKEKGGLTVELKLKQVLNNDTIARLEEGIARAYSLGGVIINPKYPPELFASDGFLWLIDRLKSEFPRANGFLNDSSWNFDGKKLSVCLTGGGLEYLDGCTEYIKKLAHDEYGLSVTTEFIGGVTKTETVNDDIDLEKIRREAVEKAVRETPSVKKEVKKKTTKLGDLILGKVANGNRVSMGDIDEESGKVSVTGEVFEVTSRELPRTGGHIIEFSMTDKTGSIKVSMMLSRSKYASQGKRPNAKNGRVYVTDEEISALSKAIKVGDYLTVQGETEYDSYGEETVIRPENIFREKRQEKTDDAPEKRVELHLHTVMSAMDGLTDTAKVIETAAKWGHKAVAITDHGVVQAFPDAMKAQKGKNIKVLYGCEAYYTDDCRGAGAVRGSANSPIDGEFVAFDLETTGLSPKNDRIIEIGAVIFRKGEPAETFESFVNPKRPIPDKSRELTGITDDDVANAPGEEEILPKLMEFIGDRPLIAHNAPFDIGFLIEALGRTGFDHSRLVSFDTLEALRIMSPGIRNYKLGTVAEHFKLPSFKQHRALSDTIAAGHVALLLLERMKKKGVRLFSEVNDHLTDRIQGNDRVRRSYHMILLCKNEAGLRNLYELVSDAHLKYFRKQPLIPKSRLDKLREGLIVGSACESGELFSAIVRGAPQKEIEEIAGYYDYLEIQPIANNAFMLRNGMAKDEEELRGYNRTIVRLGEKLGIPVAATGDVHFLEPEDEIYRRILMAGKGFTDADDQPPLYFKTTTEMLEEFSYLGEDKALEVVVKNTNMIADMCENVKPIRSGVYSPKIKDSDKELERIVRAKALELYGENPPQIISDRLETELKTIIKHHFDVIYLIAQKLVSRSLEEGYLVGSRGSVGSSFAAYLADITEVNSLPAHYRCPACRHVEFPEPGLYPNGIDMPDKDCPNCGEKFIKDGFDIDFSTFLGFGGDKKPDIDLNFSGEYQARAHRHTVELFGEEKVFRAGTIGTIAKKTAYGYVKKYYEERGIEISKAEENRLSLGCVGVKRLTGQHPGGLVVVPEGNEIYEFCPVQHPADGQNTDVITTHFDYHAIEENLLKLDNLGHDDPTMIRMLSDLTGVDALKIPLDDKKTMSLFTSPEALGISESRILGKTGACAVPEFGTRFVREMLNDIKPTTFNELLGISGLSHGTDVWLGNAKELIKSGTAEMKDIITTRDDITFYLINKGLEPKKAFDISENVRKGKGLRPDMEELMRSKSVPEWYIESCQKISYLFPRSHAVAYVIMAFRIAWFKVYYPREFYSAYFSIRARSFDPAVMTVGIETVEKKLAELEKSTSRTQAEDDMFVTLEVCYEFYRRGLSFDKIDIYKSDASKFLPSDKGLLPPFMCIPGLGERAAADVIEGRKDGPFISAEEMSRRCPKLSKTHIEQLRALGAMGDLPETNQMTLF